MSAAERWRRQVETHHEQSLRAQEGLDLPEDFWRPYASIFRDDPHRRDDPLVERLSREVAPDGTVLDVGGGAGRLALPLALRCRWVTVVEPSPSMVAELWDAAAEAGIGNVTAVEEDWERCGGRTGGRVYLLPRRVRRRRHRAVCAKAVRQDGRAGDHTPLHRVADGPALALLAGGAP